MRPDEITVEQVKAELQSLIDAEPDNTGWVQSVRGNDPGCVYFLSEEDRPVTANNSDDWDYRDEVTFVTPVCIIGRWVRDYHPEFENIPELNMIFKENRSLGSCVYDHPFRNDVFRVLRDAQAIQDLEDKKWGDINLDNSY